MPTGKYTDKILFIVLNSVPLKRSHLELQGLSEADWCLYLRYPISWITPLLKEDSFVDERRQIQVQLDQRNYQFLRSWNFKQLFIIVISLRIISKVSNHKQPTDEIIERGKSEFEMRWMLNDWRASSHFAVPIIYLPGICIYDVSDRPELIWSHR